MVSSIMRLGSQNHSCLCATLYSQSRYVSDAGHVVDRRSHSAWFSKFAKSEKPARQASAMTRDEAEKFLGAVRDVCPEWHPFFSLRCGPACGKAS